MRYAGFVGPTYTGRSLVVTGERCINFYPESVKGASDPEAAYVLLSTPGTSLFSALPTSPLQAVYTEPNSKRVFAVAGQVLYEVASSGSYTNRGNVETGYYTFASNGSQVMISCAGIGAGYIFDLTANTLTRITAGGFMGTTSCRMIDNYFISLVPNSRKFQISSLLDGTQWDALDFALVEGGPENVVGMIDSHRELWMFGSQHGEIYTDTGAANFPFERAGELFIEQGLAAAQSLVQMDNSVFWLGLNDKGQCRVFRTDSYNAVGVSNRSTEYFFNQYAKNGGVSDAVAYGYQNESGHSFYVISFPSATAELSPQGGSVQGVVKGATWVYDVAENMWHERASFKAGVYGAHAGRFHAFGYGQHLVGGGDGTGNLYVLSEDVYQDNKQPIKRVRRAPHLVDELKVITYPKLRVSMNVGAGPSGDANNVGTLRVSNDGGMTWGNEHDKPLGDAGQYQQIVEWRALGRSMRRAFEFSTMINAPVCLADAFVNAVEGTR